MAERAAIEHFDYLHLLAQVKQRVRLAQLTEQNTQLSVAQLPNMLPKDLRSSLPSIEDIERDLSEPTE